MFFDKQILQEKLQEIVNFRAREKSAVEISVAETNLQFSIAYVGQYQDDGSAKLLFGAHAFSEGGIKIQKEGKPLRWTQALFQHTSYNVVKKLFEKAIASEITIAPLSEKHDGRKVIDIFVEDFEACKAQTVMNNKERAHIKSFLDELQTTLNTSATITAEQLKALQQKLDETTPSSKKESHLSAPPPAEEKRADKPATSKAEKKRTNTAPFNKKIFIDTLTLIFKIKLPDQQTPPPSTGGKTVETLEQELVDQINGIESVSLPSEKHFLTDIHELEILCPPRGPLTWVITFFLCASDTTVKALFDKMLSEANLLLLLAQEHEGQRIIDIYLDKLRQAGDGNVMSNALKAHVQNFMGFLKKEGLAQLQKHLSDPKQTEGYLNSLRQTFNKYWTTQPKLPPKEKFPPSQPAGKKDKTFAAAETQTEFFDNPSFRTALERLHDLRKDPNSDANKIEEQETFLITQIKIAPPTSLRRLLDTHNPGIGLDAKGPFTMLLHTFLSICSYQVLFTFVDRLRTDPMWFDCFHSMMQDRGYQKDFEAIIFGKRVNDGAIGVLHEGNRLLDGEQKKEISRIAYLVSMGHNRPTDKEDGKQTPSRISHLWHNYWRSVIAIIFGIALIILAFTPAGPALVAALTLKAVFAPIFAWIADIGLTGIGLGFGLLFSGFLLGLPSWITGMVVKAVATLLIRVFLFPLDFIKDANEWLIKKFNESKIDPDSDETNHRQKNYSRRCLCGASSSPSLDSRKSSICPRADFDWHRRNRQQNFTQARCLASKITQP